MPVNATFGTVEYRENGEIGVPVTFGENVVAGKSIVEIARVSGDTLTGLEYRLVGSGTDFSVIISVPPDRSGRFSLNLAGSVFKRTDSTWDTATATAVKNVDYSTVVPRIVDWDIPADYTPGETFDVRVAYNVKVTGLSDNNVQQVFLLEGAADTMGTPTPYKWTGDTAPDFEVPVPEDLTETDWQQLKLPPANVPITAENDFDENGFWHGAANEGQYFMVRWTVQENTTGIFSMTPRDGTVRGPISS